MDAQERPAARDQSLLVTVRAAPAQEPVFQAATLEAIIEFPLNILRLRRVYSVQRRLLLSILVIDEPHATCPVQRWSEANTQSSRINDFSQSLAPRENGESRLAEGPFG